MVWTGDDGSVVEGRTYAPTIDVDTHYADVYIDSYHEAVHKFKESETYIFNATFAMDEGYAYKYTAPRLVIKKNCVVKGERHEKSLLTKAGVPKDATGEYDETYDETTYFWEEIIT